MPKSIHERVRATLERAASAEKRAADLKHDARMARLARRDQRAEERIDALIAGDAIPRNAREQAIQDRAMYGELLGE